MKIKIVGKLVVVYQWMPSLLLEGLLSLGRNIDTLCHMYDFFMSKGEVLEVTCSIFLQGNPR